MQKNVASQTVTVLAIDTATNLPKTGDASNITLYYNGDNGGVTIFSTGSGHPTEDDATNSPGTYTIAATQGETNFNKINISGKSATSGIRVVPILNLQTVPAALTVAGGSVGGLVIAGSNAATTFSGLTTGAFSCTTLTASGAVAFQSTFGITGTATLAALNTGAIGTGNVTITGTLSTSGTATFNALTITNALTVSGSTSLAAVSTSGTVTFNAFIVINATTLSGAVSLGSTLGVTGTTTFAAINTGAIGTGNFTITGTLSTSGTTTFNALTVTNVFTVSGATTLTGVVTAANAGNNITGVTAVVSDKTGFSLATTQTFNNTGTWTGNIVGTLSTLTTYTGNTPQTGDSFARIGANGANLTSVGLAATQAFNNTGTWTGNVSGTVGGTAGTTQTFDALQTALNSTHGSGSWATATGFATPTNITAGTITTVSGNVNGSVGSVSGLTNATISSAVFTTAMTESYNTDGSPATLSQGMYVLMQLLTEITFAGTTGTVKKLDGSTTAYTLTVNDATTPTSITRST